MSRLITRRNLIRAGLAAPLLPLYSNAAKAIPLPLLGGAGNGPPPPIVPIPITAYVTPDLWLDPSDLTSMFQEITGASATTPVTVGSPVGSILNKGALGGWVTAPATGNRPTLQQANNVFYLSFDGSTSCMRSANGFMNAATISMFVGVRSNATQRIIASWPQAAAVHTSPYFRFAIIDDLGNNIQVGLNGVFTSNVQGFSANTDQVSEFHSSTGAYLKNGNSFLSASGATVTYPNSVPFLLGCDAVNGELFSGRIYQVLGMQSEPTTQNALYLRSYAAFKSGITWVPGQTSFGGVYLVDQNGNYLQSGSSFLASAA